MQVTADAGGGFRVATQATHLALQFAGRIGTLTGTLNEERFQFGVLHIIGRGLEAFLAILAVLDQVVEHVDHVFVGIAHGTNSLAGGSHL
ncbi:hypothetical protein D3C84_1191970 [compost metagenome]